MSTITSAVGGLLGGAAGSSAGPSSVNTYYPDVGQNTQTYQNVLGNQVSNINSLQNTAAPGALNNYATASNNPFAAAFQTGAGTAGNAYTNAGNSAYGAGTSVMNSASPLQGYASQIMQMGLDPQNALYNQQLQGATDTANATNAQYGLTGPWAAGNTNQATQNFNNNWQNQQLSRAIQALGAGSGADQAAGALDTMGNTLQSTGAADLYQGAGLPYNTAQGISNNQNVNLNDLITNLGGINNIDSSTMSSLLQYLSNASGYGIQQNQGQQNATAAGASGGMDLGGLIGGGLSALF
jgi:hypothetical protein